ncbi:hypothetical protein D3C73_1368020 [compost metagenome]
MDIQVARLDNLLGRNVLGAVVAKHIHQRLLVHPAENHAGGVGFRITTVDEYFFVVIISHSRRRILLSRGFADTAFSVNRDFSSHLK